MHKILLFIVVCITVKYTFFPIEVVYAMGPDGQDVLDAYAQNNPISKAQMVPDPRTYWQEHPYENDAYAQHQRALSQNVPSPVVGDSYYEIVPGSVTRDGSSAPLSNFMLFKRKIVWIFWKRHTGEFGSYKEFKKSWKNNPSIRKQIKEDFKKGRKK